jgi:hypothetical protein
MNDRELLELAAKAAGIDYDMDASFPKDATRPFFGLWLNIKCEPYEGQRRRWNPLTDDGDRYRLAMKLRLFSGNRPALDRWVSAYQFHGDGMPYEQAFALGIVRAAAEIGKATP